MDWRLIPPEDGFYQRKKQSPLQPLKATLTHNTTAPPLKKTQYGGCAALAFKEILPRVVDTSCDPEGLGRWVSQLIEGAAGHNLRYVVGYMPCVNHGETTVYTQHQEHFRNQKTDREPCQAMLEDFYQALHSWDRAGEKLVVCMDANQDVRTGTLAQMFLDLGFGKEQITSRHGAYSPPPATQDTNTKGKVIDGIWVNFNQGDLRCSFLPFGSGIPGDHRDTIIDIPFEAAFGYKPPHLHRVYPPNLTTQNPRERKQYNKRVTKTLKENGTIAKVIKMRKMVANNSTIKPVRDLHHKISVARKEAGLAVAAKIRKKRTGAFANSPQLSLMISETMLWSKIIRLKQGKAMGCKQIRRLMTK